MTTVYKKNTLKVFFSIYISYSTCEPLLGWFKLFIWCYPGVGRLSSLRGQHGRGVFTSSRSCLL